MNDFVQFARAHGVEISELQQGDRIYRCPTTTHPKSANGAYLWTGDRGMVWNWETNDGPQWWNDNKSTPWSESEKAEWARRRRNAEADRAKAQADAAKRAAVMISGATRQNHPYLKEKGLGDVLALVSADWELIVPMRDVKTNALLGAQVIKICDYDWQKKFLYGQRSKGAVYRIGSERAAETIFCEGLATGLSIDIALRLLSLNASVLVCFSAQNLVHVAPMVGGRRFVFADNDKSGTGESVAKETGLPYCMSPEVGEDANDLFVRSGPMAVAKLLMEVRRR